MKSNSRTMQFLYKRTTLIVVSIEGRYSIGRYVPDRNVTILGRGTGVFIEKAGRVFVATNDHVLRAHRFHSRLGTRVHVALADKAPFAEFHDGYAFAARDFVDDGSGHAKLDAEGHPIPREPLSDTDLAVVRLSAQSVEVASKAGREFVQWEEITDATSDAQVCFRGYPRENVDFIPSLDRFDVDGFSLFTHVVRTAGTRVVVDATEKALCFGSGSVHPERDLHGISGSGLFDMTGKLVGIVYGGDPAAKAIFACAARELNPLLEMIEGGAEVETPFPQ